MGLQPVYVGILQRQWMRDDIATITNTYPDHEDVQGPAGIDVAEVMTNFIPRNSRLLTSEEQMLPVLRTAATQVGTKMRAVSWFEAGMLTPDVMNRFPYEEHPFNVALVLTLADELGVERDFAIKEIADRVVPDLGALKTYPAAEVRGRKLEFIMGMSANERLGCLTNWARMNMDTQDPYESPGVWVSTVVNNRADRVPRSRVFASIIAADVSVDRHILIGTNIKGLYGYIREAWQSHAANLTLWPEQQDGDSDASMVFEAAARRMRVPLSDSHVNERLQAMLTGLGVLPDRAAALDANAGDDTLKQGLTVLELDAYSDDIIETIGAARTAYQEYRGFAQRLGAGSADRPRIDQEYRDLMWRWLEAKLVVVDDPHTPGEQIIDRISRETPPGIRNRIMGMQNIKGTGLDFVYRWEAWLACHTACEQLRGADAAVANEGLRFLVGFREFGMLSELFVRQTIAHVEQHGAAHGERFRSELSVVLSNLDQTMNELRRKSSGSGSAGSTSSARIAAYIANWLEALLDVGDAVKRRKIAKQIYTDLVNERIGQQRAVLELQKLNKRQKGGWVALRISDFFARLRRDPTSSPAEAKG
jgi:poly-gamma-glutamate synthase PgsB/CapB